MYATVNIMALCGMAWHGIACPDVPSSLSDSMER